MTWFSSGLINLKEQLNSLMNDDEESDSRISAAESTKITENLFEVSSSRRDVTGDLGIEISKDGDFSSPTLSQSQSQSQSPSPSQSSYPHHHDHYRNNAIKHAKLLSNYLSEVSLLNATLHGVADEVVRYIEEVEFLRNEVKTLKNNDVNVVVSDGLVEKMQCDTNENKVARCSKKVEENNAIPVEPTNDAKQQQCKEERPMPLVKLGEPHQQQQCTDTANNCSTYDVISSQYANEYDKVDEVTEQIENLIMNVDDLTERLNSKEKAWRKISENCRDGLLGNAEIATIFNEYLTYAKERDVLWERLKVTFVWPTVAKFKNIKISELSVPDSIKEVFQPGGVAKCRGNDDTCERSIPQQQQQQQQQQFSTKGDGATGKKGNLAVTEKDHFGGESLTSTSHEEVNRLRKHLLSVEQAYTNELLQCEEEIQILRNELKNREEKLNSLTQSYTSTNLTANQTIERLQNDMKQRIEREAQLNTQLNAYQNDLQKTWIDMHNLRSALDLFHKNRDSEIVQATEKLRDSLQTAQRENQLLSDANNTLRSSLNDFQDASKKTEILLVQLSKKDAEIISLKTQVDEMQRRFQDTETWHLQSTTNTEAIIKLDLIKNIVFRYITSDSCATRSQSLRVLANVLDFSEFERIKIGIHEGTYEKSAQNSSLIDEFIRFVEKESVPAQARAYNTVDTAAIVKTQSKVAAANAAAAMTAAAAAAAAADADADADADGGSGTLARESSRLSNSSSTFHLTPNPSNQMSSSILKDALHSDDT